MVTESPCFTNAILAVTDAYGEGWKARAELSADLLRLLSVCRDYMNGEYDDLDLGTMDLFNADLFSALKPFEGEHPEPAKEGK